MPLLDPEQQFYFASFKNKQNAASKNLFFLKYLPIASKYMLNNPDTIKAHQSFRNDFLDSINYLNNTFQLDIPSRKEIENLKILDYYNYLYHFFKPSNEIIKGEYFSFQLKTKMRCFEPFFDFSNTHRWYFMNSSFAVLAINDELLSNTNSKDAAALINLEVDVMKALGFTLVLTYHLNSAGKNHNIFFDLVKKEFFSEIHMNLDIHSYDNIQTFDDIIITIYTDIFCDSDYFNYGYFYVYLSFSPKYAVNVEVLNSPKPYLNVFFYSLELKKVFHKAKVEPIHPFVYCEAGFKSDVLEIELCHVPLFNEKLESIAITPSGISKIESAYIMKDDFMEWRGSRVEVLIGDDTTKYVNFSDIHYINPELYVKDTLHVMKTDKESLDTIDRIQSDSREQYNRFKGFVHQKINKFFHTDKMIILRGLTYLSYAVKCFRDFELHRNQLFATFEACTSCLFNDKSPDKGIIYQLETGEGKSIIIQIIAALLALNDKVVHIATSNIHLSNRDYADSYEFFKQLGIKSAVLLHYNELPYISLDNEYVKNSTISRDLYPPEYFRENLFNNSSSMNFSVCGIGEKCEEISTDVKIVFSTFINFEALYLKMMESWSPSYVGRYFNKCSLVIDEADTILIDELTNGTILSRPMLSNASEILPYIYKRRMEKADPQILLKEVKDQWPECSDMNIDDIEKMYKEIDLVNTPEFVNGKKYSIETVKDPKGRKPKSQSMFDFQQGLSKVINFQNEIKNYLIDKITKKQKEKEAKEAQAVTQLSEEEIRREFQNYKEDDNIAIPENEVQEIIDEDIRERERIERETDPNLLFIQSQTEQQEEEEEERQDSPVPTIQHEPEATQPEQSTQNNQNQPEQNTQNNLNQPEQNTQNNLNQPEQNLENNLNQPEQNTQNNLNQPEQKKMIVYDKKVIVPFDYDNKGVLEPNKEFSGFVQQFIAIKEMINNPEENKNMVIKDISLNYLYVSHPIFVKLYKNVCGFTGTVGNNFDEAVLKEQYGLKTFKIPRNKPSLRVQLPTILCRTLEERNRKILEDVLTYHQAKIPVLVVFQDLTEIRIITDLFHQYGLQYINVFDGRSEKDKPEELAGLDGAISFGTNFCGRGTDIKFKGKPLHVIVSFYSRNVRVMFQAYGRTARQGNEGTCRVICIASQYIRPVEFLKKNDMEAVLQEFILKNNKQADFIEHYRNIFDWLFSNTVGKQSFDHEDAKKLKESRINVNRIKACNYKYPICMSIDTFLSIQSQKIFSLYNCPNSKFTWRLFIRYIREMILESWSLLVDEVERNYFISNDNTIRAKYPSYEEYLNVKMRHLYKKIAQYIPVKKKKDIVSTYIGIYEKVIDTWTPKFDSLFNNKYLIKKRSCFSRSFISINFGFMPFSLMDKSGSKINSFDWNSRNSYIRDPELSYLRLQGNGKPSVLASITEKVDGLFDTICSTINAVIGGFIGLRFFMRRTLAGIEIGVCVDFDISNIDKETLGPNCLIDKDPLFLFTIQIKSLTPIFAGILIIVLVFAAKLSTLIFDNITKIIRKFVNMGVKLTVITAIRLLATKGLKSQIDKLIKNIIDVLSAKLVIQIANIGKYDAPLADKFRNFSAIFIRNECSSISEQLLNILGRCFILNAGVRSLFTDIFPLSGLLRIAFVLVLSLIAFFINFRNRRAIKNNKQLSEKEEAKNSEKDLFSSKKFNIEAKTDQFEKNSDPQAALQNNEAIINSLYPDT
ncbi:hypothetical protein M9Y10_041326 [Tritrichomonas musculus]|uniref:SecA family profile domain-containing protein n=1 Tax=Tritrichomonas musculus TaxID=1915356 RepID=A0ABR2K412_9EUKA